MSRPRITSSLPADHYPRFIDGEGALNVEPASVDLAQQLRDDVRCVHQTVFYLVRSERRTSRGAWTDSNRSKELRSR